MLELNKIYQGDCLELMKEIEDKSINLILCDLPYGTTACSWDEIIPLVRMWKEMLRVIKNNSVMVFTASQPFTSKLIMSNVEMFKEELIWNKHRASNFSQSKNRHMKYHESIIIFSKGKYGYYPQMIKRESPRVLQAQRTGWKGHNSISEVSKNGNNKFIIDFNKYSSEIKLPSSIIVIPAVVNNSHEYNPHPTQKPVALFEYLIKTYTNEGDLVLDNCIGSGTTAVACINTNRRFIGIELEPKYVEIANQRIKEALAQSKLCVVEKSKVSGGKDEN